MGAVKNFIGDIAWGQNIVTALLAVLGTIIVIHYTDKAPNLVYEAFPPAQFATQETQISIYNARVENIGDREAEDVQVRFELLPSANIQELKVELSLANIQYSIAETESSNIRDIYFPILNHGESASFSVLADKGQADPIGMVVRGRGVIGNTDRNVERNFLMSVVTVGIVAFFMASGMWVARSTGKIVDLVRFQKRVTDTELRIVRTRERTPANELIDTLVSTTYRLHFNPRMPGLGGTKLIRFGAGGGILEGRNNNETTWTIRNDLLEIVNSDGQVHSRFYYSPNDGRFFHTNDPDTISVQRHGIGDQFMMPDPK